MAWLKIETHTPDKPEVFAIASKLGIDPDAVFGKCFRVWVWFDAHTTNGKTNGIGVSAALIDRVAGVSGFAEAMASAEWLTFTGEGYEVPNFDRHNGETAKQRALTAKRVAKHTNKTNAETNAPAVSEALPREEKIREELTTTVLRTDADASRPQTDEEIIFGYGVPMLTSAGSSEKHARSFLGSLRKAHGDSAVVAKLRDCFRAKPLQPIEWLAAALPPAGRGGGGKQSAVEARNARVVADWVPPEMRGEA